MYLKLLGHLRDSIWVFAGGVRETAWLRSGVQGGVIAAGEHGGALGGHVRLTSGVSGRGETACEGHLDEII